MASTKELEDTLPFYCPEEPGDNHFGNPLGSQYAVYTLVVLDDAGLQKLLHTLNTGDMSNGNCLLAPRPNFAGQSLRDIYDYHLQARREDTNVHPYYFIVTDQENWADKGVLMVYLKVGRDVGNDDYEEVVGVGRCGVDMADCVGANLDIANVDWIDYKEEEEQEWGGENPYENKRYFKRNPLEGRESQV